MVKMSEVNKVSNINNTNKDKLERNILHIKSINNIIIAKLRMTVLRNMKKKAPNFDFSNLDIENEMESLLALYTKEKLENDLHRYSLLNSCLITYIFNNQFEDPKQQNYKKKIIEQLEYLKEASDEVKELHLKQEHLIAENIKVSNELAEFQNAHNMRLKGEKMTLANNSLRINESYEEQKKGIELRIDKINLMRHLISRLLFYGKVTNWAEYPELINILYRSRTSYNMETLRD